MLFRLLLTFLPRSKSLYKTLVETSDKTRPIGEGMASHLVFLP